MGNSIQKQIEKSYGQEGIKYVTFRFHERKIYQKMKQKISQVMARVNLEHENSLLTISRENQKLKRQLELIKNSRNISKLSKASHFQHRTYNHFSDQSDYIQQVARLDNLYKEINSKYENQKALVQKKIREYVMKRLNRSKLKTIHEFDTKSDKARRKIENQCIHKHPQNAQFTQTAQILQHITWQNYRQYFEDIFQKQSLLALKNTAEQKITSLSLATQNIFCC